MRWRTLWIGCTAFGLGAAATTLGQTTPMLSEPPVPCITVYGNGEILAPPNLIEIDVRVMGSAELTADALVKYRDAKKRVHEAFTNLKMKDLAWEADDVLIAANDPAAQQRYYGGSPPANVKVKSEISSTMRLRLKNVANLNEEQAMETIGRLLDVAKDAGAGVGPSQEQINLAWRYGRPVTGSLARFVVDDFQERREQAYEAAVKDARERGERLARLSGVKLGPVYSVTEVASPGEAPTAPTSSASPQGTPGTTERGMRLVSDSFGKIPVRVRLLVRFRIAEAKEASGGPEVRAGGGRAP